MMEKKIQPKGKKEKGMTAFKKPKQQLAWHAPTLQRLQLSLDTAFSGGSLADGFTGTT